MDRPKLFTNESILEWLSQHGELRAHGYGYIDSYESHHAPHNGGDTLSYRYDVHYSSMEIPTDKTSLVLELSIPEVECERRGVSYPKREVYSLHNVSKESKKILMWSKKTAPNGWFGGNDDRLLVIHGYHGTYVTIPKHLQ
tara:strand:- start:803 stop:1225 length:423 start_codon:yes stop_codon:yes gene_type:complete